MTNSDKVFFENRSFRDYGRSLTPHSVLAQEFPIASLGITLLPGEYRLVKSFSPKEGAYTKVSLAVPFTVADNRGE